MNFLLLKKSLISEVGILKAGILAYIYASISPKINSKDLIDGHPWCYDTYATLSNTFATSSSTIKRNINELVDGGYLLKAHHNSSKGDMTSYYTFTDASWSHYLSEKDDKKIKNTHEVKMSQCMRSKCTNALGQNEPMHEVKMTPSTIYTNTHTNTHTNTICENDNLANKGVLSNVSKKDDTLQISSRKSVTEGLKTQNNESQNFVAFWKLYPRKIAKQNALESFNVLTEEEIERLLYVLENGLYQFSKEMQYIPHPATFLNQKRFSDCEKPAAIQQVYEYAAEKYNDTAFAKEVSELYKTSKNNGFANFKAFVDDFYNRKQKYSVKFF